MMLHLAEWVNEQYRASGTDLHSCPSSGAQIRLASGEGNEELMPKVPIDERYKDLADLLTVRETGCTGLWSKQYAVQNTCRVE